MIFLVLRIRQTLVGFIALIAFELLPYHKTKIRKATTKSKFYFFDCGVVNYFSRRLPMVENSSDLGVNFEQFIILELRAYLSYRRIKKEMTYWRSKEVEVDLIIDNEMAIEIKFSKTFKNEFTKGLLKLKEEKLIKNFFIVGRFPSDGDIKGITYMSYENFLKALWSDKLLSL